MQSSEMTDPLSVFLVGQNFHFANCQLPDTAINQHFYEAALCNFSVPDCSSPTVPPFRSLILPLKSTLSPLQIKIEFSFH